MTTHFIQYAIWQLAKLSKQLGLIGGLGAALILVCSLVYLSTLLPLSKQISDLRIALENVPITKKNNLNVRPLPANNLAEDIAAFKQTLPPANTLHEWLALIDQTAGKYKLLLNRGDYKYNKAKQIQISEDFYLSKYEIVLPIAGQYGQIRQFIAQVLELQPALALSDLKITRDNSLSPNVEARLVFTLYLQGQLALKSGQNIKSELK